jgi:hypothetical protein
MNIDSRRLRRDPNEVFAHDRPSPGTQRAAAPTICAKRLERKLQTSASGAAPLSSPELAHRGPSLRATQDHASGPSVAAGVPKNQLTY